MEQIIEPDHIANLECKLADIRRRALAHSEAIGRYIKYVESDFETVKDDLQSLKAEIDSLLKELQ